MKYQFTAFASLTLSNAKTKLIQHTEKVGSYENFGQEVISYLKDKYKYDPYSHEDKDIKVFIQINQLEKWCSTYSR